MVSKPYEKNIFQASCWLLCSLGRTSPALLNLIFESLGVSDKAASEFSTNTLDAIGLICQSQHGVKYLIEKKHFDDWAHIVVDICSSTSHNRIGQLCSLIECFSQLSSIDAVVQYFDTNEGGAMLRHLIEYMVKFCSSSSAGTSDQSGHGYSQKLLDSSITFIRRCLAYGGGHRERIAFIMTDLIYSSTSFERKGVPLCDTLEKLVLQLVITDESIPVRLTGVVQKNLESQTLESKHITLNMIMVQ